MSALRVRARTHWLGLMVLCLGLWGFSFVATGMGLSGLTVALRTIASLLVVCAWVMIFRYGPRRLLLSPLTHLAAFSLLFYGWCPSLSLVLMDLNLDAGLYSTRDNYDFVGAYVGGRSEMLVVGFACLCLGAFALTAATLPGNRRSNAGVAWDHLPRAVGWGAISGIVCLIFVLVASVSWWQNAWAETPFGKEVFRAVPVVFSFLAAVLVAALSKEHRGQLLLGTAAIVGGLFVLVFINRAQMPLLIAYSLVLLIAVSRAPSPRQMIGIGLSCLAFLSIVIVSLVTLRPAHDTMSPISPTHRVMIMAEQKFVTRQAVSAACFNKLADIGLSKVEIGNPFYFVVAVVPRIVWPDKPNLSRGTEFALLCGETGAEKDGHSESVTILGEPLFEAGYRGLLAAELTLVVMLGALTILALTGGPVRMLALTALLPWLLAVEHHYALFMGNAVKMALIVSPFALMLYWILHRMPNLVPGSNDNTPHSARIGVN